MEQPANPRLQLTTVRGLACLALVAYHVVGPGQDSGMHLPESSAWHYAIHSFDFLRMPLFSVLSGYFYARHRISASTLSDFLVRKGIRLGVPLLFVTAVMFHLRRVAYGDPTTFFEAALFHYQHLWFLQALILIFVAIAISDSFVRLNTIGLCLAGFGAVMVSRSFTLPALLSLNGAFYLAPFFLFGMLLQEEPALLKSASYLRSSIWVIAVVILVQQAGTFGAATPLDRTSLPATLCGCAAAYTLFVLCPRVALLETIGTYSFTIYLWHSIASAAVRTVIERHFSLGTGFEFVVLLVTAVGIPVAIHRILADLPYLRTLFMGLPTEIPALLPVLKAHGKPEAAQFATPSHPVSGAQPEATLVTSQERGEWLEAA